MMRLWEPGFYVNDNDDDDSDLSLCSVFNVHITPGAPGDGDNPWNSG